MKNIPLHDSAREIPDHLLHSQEQTLARPERETRSSDSPYIEQIGRLSIERESVSLCPASGHWNMLVVRYQDEISLSVWGPMTKGAAMRYREGAEILSITFPLGTFLPQMPVDHLVDTGEFLPRTSATSFWLGNFLWQFPGYENVEIFVNKLVCKGLLVHDPVVDAALQDQEQAMSKRSIQRRFRQATGLSLRTLQAIERAQHAATLLQQGISVLDTVEEAGYFDQPHLTKALKRFIGQTPTQIARMGKP